MQAKRIGVTAAWIAIGCVVVRLIQVPIVATGGFACPGAVAEIFVSLAFGPMVGKVASGVGAVLADLTPGCGRSAPLTLPAHAGPVGGLSALETRLGPHACGLGFQAVLDQWCLTSWVSRGGGRGRRLMDHRFPAPQIGMDCSWGGSCSNGCASHEQLPWSGCTAHRTSLTGRGGCEYV